MKILKCFLYTALMFQSHAHADQFFNNFQDGQGNQSAILQGFHQNLPGEILTAGDDLIEILRRAQVGYSELNGESFWQGKSIFAQSHLSGNQIVYHLVISGNASTDSIRAEHYGINLSHGRGKSEKSLAACELALYLVKGGYPSVVKADSFKKTTDLGSKFVQCSIFDLIKPIPEEDNRICTCQIRDEAFL